MKSFYLGRENTRKRRYFALVPVFIWLLLIPIFILKNSIPIDNLEIISGFIKPKEKDNKMYYETLINYYDPDPAWEPGEKLGTGNAPEIVGETALLVELDTGNILYEKNMNEVKEIASLVKIMTAVVALEHKRLDSEITVSKEAAEIGENTMGISAGEKYTLEELLYGLMLSSGNDAAYAIAEGVAGNTETFIKWMNLKSDELGLKSSKFSDPSGLDDTTRSTALDLVKLSKYAMKNPKFRKIVGTYEIELPFSEKHKYLYLWNQTNLLTTYQGVAGIKTGYTEDAGLCLATYAKNDGKEVIGVVLNSIDRKGDMILMLDQGFSTIGVTVEHNLM